MKKIFSLFVALTAVMSLSAKTIYLQVNEDWKSYGAVFFVHSWGGAADADVKFAVVDGEDYLFSAVIPEDNNKVIFVRAQGECTSIPWDTDKLWNKTADLEIPEGKDCFWILGWEGGAWLQKGQLPQTAIVGNFEGDATWAPQPGYILLPELDGKSASVTLENLTAGTYQMKVWIEGSFLSLNGAGEEGLYRIHREWSNVDNVNIVNDGRNFEFVADITGDYTFSWTFASQKLVVTFPDNTPTAVENTTVADKAVKCIENGQLIIVRDGVQYNVLGGVVR